MLGIVIINYNNYNKTIDCIESILQTYFNVYIVIIDNSYNNKSFDILTKKYYANKKVEIFKMSSNLGYAKGNNVGIEKCKIKKCRNAIICNNDVIFKKNSIRLMYDFIVNKKDAVIVGPKIFFNNNKLQHSSRLKKISYYNLFGLNKKIKQIDEENINIPVKVYSVSGCCFIIDIHKFIEINAFDPNTFLYNEENILGVQVERSNYNMYFLPKAVVSHEHGASTGKQNMFINKEYMKSSLYYWKNYRKISNLKLYLIWILLTLKWIIKSIYCKKLRDEWKEYFISTLKYLNYISKMTSYDN